MKIVLDSVFSSFSLYDNEIISELKEVDNVFIDKNKYSGVVTVFSKDVQNTFEKLCKIIKEKDLESNFIFKDNHIYSITLAKKLGVDQTLDSRKTSKPGYTTVGEMLKQIDKIDLGK